LYTLAEYNTAGNSSDDLSYETISTAEMLSAGWDERKQMLHA